MQDVALFALLGLGGGALIAGLALAVIVFYRGSGIINLATGAIAMVAGFVFWSFDNGKFGFHPPWPVSFVLTLLFMAVLGVVIELCVFWPLRRTSPLAKLAASLGLLLVAQAAIVAIFGATTESARSVLSGNTVTIFGRVVPVDRFELVGIAVFATVVLSALYRWSRFGLATRAAAENETVSMLAGLSPYRLSLANTVLASIVAATFGVLVAPLIQLDPSTEPFLIVPALGAALFARFTSFWIACIAALAMGAAAQLLIYASGLSWFPQDKGAPMRGLQELLFFVLVVIAMAWRGRTLPSRGEIVEKRLPLAPRPERLLRSSVIAAVAGATALIVLPYDFRQALINSMLGALICLSLIVIVGYVGQVSVVQLALAGAAGFAMSHLLTDVGGFWARFPIAPLAGIGVALIIGVLTAFSSLRVRGVSLAVVTLAGAVAIENFGFGNQTWGALTDGSPIAPLHVGGLNLSSDASFRGVDGKLPSPIFGFVVLGVVILMCLLVANLRRSSLGAKMLAVRSNERASAAAGIDVRGVKLAAFAIAAVIAGVAASPA
jgi:branched-chain amino acid transport system permease protein